MMMMMMMMVLMILPNKFNQIILHMAILIQTFLILLLSFYLSFLS